MNSTVKTRAPRGIGQHGLLATHWRLFRESRYLTAMFALPLVYFLVFKYGPMFGLAIAFQDYDIVKGVSGSPWTGITHFRAFLADEWFWATVRNTIVLNIYVIVFYFPMPIVLALLLNEVRSPALKKFVQTVTYLPHFLSTVVVAGMVVNFVANDGLVNEILARLGIGRVQFLTRPEWFRSIYVVSDIWQRVGWGAIIYLAALSGIDPALYEAAVLDGANRFQQMRHITVPGIAPVVSIIFLLTLGHIMNVGFEKVLLLYNGALYDTADVIQTYVYRRGLLGADFSYGTAVGLFQSFVAFALIVTANSVARRIGATSLW
jgi:putative aldouronate transport system permease protein